MFSSRNIVLHFVFVCCIGATHVLGPVSRDIAPTDTILQVMNEIFSCVKIKLNENSNNKELLIHLVGFSRYKSDNWKEILRLTSFNIKTDNSSSDYMSTVINEVMNKGNRTGGGIDIRNDVDVIKKKKNFLNKFREVHLRKLFNRTLNNKTSQLFAKARTSLRAETVKIAENATEDIKAWVPNQSRRIFQGQQTRISYYPFVASIHIFTQFTCAGSIIAADLVITAASCLQLAYNNRFYRENARFLAVRVGSSYYGVEGDLIPVLEVYFHSSYDPPTLHNNLAIVRLQRYIRFRNRSRVKKVDIDTNANALPWNTDGIVIVGWGSSTVSNKLKSPMMDKIAESVLDFYPLEECQEIYSKTFVTERHFCAGFISRGGGACNRDVGAPGLAGGRLVGVVSFGSASCGAADAPTVFTKLGFYTDWIEEIMAQETRDYINRPTATYRPYPIHTIETTTLAPNEFAIEPLERPLKAVNRAVSYDSNEEPAGFELRSSENRQMENRNIEFAELTKNKNTQELAEIPSATTIRNYTFRDNISKFTVLDKLLQIDKLRTKSHVVKQLQKPGHSLGPVDFPVDKKYTKFTAETNLNLEQLEKDDSDVVDKLLNEVNTELDMKYTKTDKLPQKDRIKITMNKVFPDQQSKDVKHFNLTYNKKYTKSVLPSNKKKIVSLNTNTFVANNKIFSKAEKEFAMYNSVAKRSPEPVQFDGYEFIDMPLPQIVSPKKENSAGEIKERISFEKVADSPRIDENDLKFEQPGVPFSDPEINHKITDLIDYMNVIDKISYEQEQISNIENIIGANNSPEDLKNTNNWFLIIGSYEG